MTLSELLSISNQGLSVICWDFVVACRLVRSERALLVTGLDMYLRYTSFWRPQEPGFQVYILINKFLATRCLAYRAK